MPRETAIDSDMRGRSQSRDIDRSVAALAGGQHGVVGRRQLLALGLSRWQVDRRVYRGALIPLHRGVYAVGHRALSRNAHRMAAVMACGEGAVLSHRDAASLWGIRDCRRAVIEVVCAGRTRPVGGIQIHYGRLQSDEVTSRDGIPVTTPSRTLFDLAAVLDRHRLERAFHEAEVLRLLSPLSLPALLARHPGRRGAQALRAILDDLADRGVEVTRSEFEDRFLEVLDDAGLPRPDVNAEIPTALRAYEVDATWTARRLAVELDGSAAHRTRRAFEEDRVRDRALAVAGWTVVRITWRELRDRPDRVAADVANLLA